MLTEAEVVRFWEKVEITETCWNWTRAKRSRGYGAFGVRRLNRVFDAHRLSWEFSYGPIPPGLFVCHHCDNPACVRPDHLFIGTHQDNMDDMKSKGRQGERRGGKPSIPIAIRLWKHTVKSNGCWEWIGSHDGKGYGMIGSGHGNTTLRAHRASWEIHFGSIPSSLQIFQRCGNRACVRPDHLGIGTARDTALRGAATVASRHV